MASPGAASTAAVPVLSPATGGRNRPGDWRDHFGVWALLAGGTAAVFALAAPAPLTIVGDPAARLRFVSIGAGAVLVVLLLWRGCRGDHRGVARSPAAAADLVAAFFGVLTVALSRSFWRAVMTAGPAAPGALLALAALVLAEQVVRRPADGRAGVGLALVAGAAVGGPLSVPAVGWPLGVLVVTRAVRRRERWPMLAGLTFTAAAAAGLGLWARAWAPERPLDLAGQLFLVPVFRALGHHLTIDGLAAAALDLVDQVGILGLLVAAAGLSRLRRTALVFTFWPLGAGLVLRTVLGGGPEGTIGIIVAAASLALPLAAGMARLGQRLGRAALPAVAVIGVIVAIWPLLAR